MALTGHEEGEPLVPNAAVLAHAGAALAMIGSISGAPPASTSDAAQFLFGRAALLALTRHGRVAAGGTCRLLRTDDGWVAVNLARPEDVASIPAIIEHDDGGDHVAALEDAARTRGASDLAARCQLLGVPAAALGTAGAHPPPVRFERAGVSDDVASKPTVVDLSSLWAGPLCAHLLGLVGANVIKVESSQRPDGARAGSAGFFDWLHAGHRSVVLDFASDEGQQRLLRLLRSADVVIEASRPRALRQLGIDAADVVAAGAGRTWVSITGYGRADDTAQLVAFGDDAAVAGGLVACDSSGDPVFCGDAIADPLTGMFAAMAACASVMSGGGQLIDIAMSGVAAHVASSLATEPGPFHVSRLDAGEWTVDHGGTRTPVRPPRPPATSGSAEPPGASTAAIVAALGGH